MSTVLPPHQCEQMIVALGEEDFPVVYNPTFREFGIKYHDQGSLIIMDYCPWCGERLPKDLTDQLWDELTTLNGREPDDLMESIEEAEEFYTSGRWWAGRFDDEGNRLP